MTQEQLEYIHSEALQYTGGKALGRVPYHEGFDEQCGSSENYPHWISELAVYYGYLFGLVKTQQYKQVVELGRLYGGSALTMLLALPEDGKLMTLDYCTYTQDCLKDVKDTRLSVVTGSSMDPEFAAQSYPNKDISLLFIDTDHNYKQIYTEWNIWRPLVRSGGLIVLDDIHLNDDMERFWNQITFPKIDSGDTLHSSGFGIVGIP